MYANWIISYSQLIFYLLSRNLNRIKIKRKKERDQKIAILINPKEKRKKKRSINLIKKSISIQKITLENQMMIN